MKNIIIAIGLIGCLFGQVQQVEILSEGIKLNSYFYEAPGKGLKPTIIWMHRAFSVRVNWTSTLE